MSNKATLNLRIAVYEHLRNLLGEGSKFQGAAAAAALQKVYDLFPPNTIGVEGLRKIYEQRRKNKWTQEKKEEEREAAAAAAAAAAPGPPSDVGGHGGRGGADGIAGASAAAGGMDTAARLTTEQQSGIKRPLCHLLRQLRPPMSLRSSRSWRHRSWRRLPTGIWRHQQRTPRRSSATGCRPKWWSGLME